MKKQWDNQEIIDNIRAGKQAAATFVFKKCSGRLLQFFKWKFKLSHEDAEDALQNSLIRFIQIFLSVKRSSRLIYSNVGMKADSTTDLLHYRIFLRRTRERSVLVPTLEHGNQKMRIML